MTFIDEYYRFTTVPKKVEKSDLSQAFRAFLFWFERKIEGTIMFFHNYYGE